MPNQVQTLLPPGLKLVDGPRDDGFDRLTRLATSLFDTPVALVSIVEFERDRQFFASECGLSEPWASARETPLTHSFCQHVKTMGCLLYTSPSPRDKRQSRMPSSA